MTDLDHAVSCLLLRHPDEHDDEMATDDSEYVGLEVGGKHSEGHHAGRNGQQTPGEHGQLPPPADLCLV